MCHPLLPVIVSSRDKRMDIGQMIKRVCVWLMTITKVKGLDALPGVDVNAQAKTSRSTQLTRRDTHLHFLCPAHLEVVSRLKETSSASAVTQSGGEPAKGFVDFDGRADLRFIWELP